MEKEKVLVMNYKWNLKTPTPEKLEAAERLAKETNISPILACLLIERGITTAEEAGNFFRPPLAGLHDPFMFPDMRKAVERLDAALGRKERIMVYGDYDVDGCTAVALVYRFLRQYTSDIEYYVPDRREEGYGVSVKAIDRARESGVRLVVALDCGIKAVDEIAYARDRGVDFIVCDHHLPGSVLPPAIAVLDALCPDSAYPCPHLSGCGVGFKLMQAFADVNGIPFRRLFPLLDLCAVSIASDIVPVIGENRILACHGLQRLNTAPSAGLHAVIRLCGLSGREISFGDIVYRIGPRINAAGRMRDAKEAVSLLVEDDPQAATEIARRIDRCNEMRKDLDKAVTEEALRVAGEPGPCGQPPTLVVYDPRWHRGVIGIVASRLAEARRRPAVVLTRAAGLATGSARSIPAFDIYKAVESCADLLENFGGHAAAVGLSMKEENLPEFRRRFEAYVHDRLPAQQDPPALDIDAALCFRDLTPKFLRDLKKLAPFGPGNPEPLFCTHGICDYGTSKVVGRGQEHIRLELVDPRGGGIVDAIAFGQASCARYVKTGRSFDICYAVGENARRQGEVQLRIEDIRPSAEGE